MPIEQSFLARIAALETRIAHLEATAETPSTVANATNADTLDTLHAISIKSKAYHDTAADFSTDSDSYVDVTGATVDVVVGATSTVIVLGVATAHNANDGAHVTIRAVCGATNGDDFAMLAAAENGVHYQGWFTGVAAGTVTVHIELHTAGGNIAYLSDHSFTVLIMPE